ncbi:MAG: hypothetical protein EHM13_05435, partial [Acidobacteria bacterium]
MRKALLALALLLVLVPVAQADSIMPGFGSVPTGWVTDRYQPASFSNVGVYEGRTDVLGIGISSNDRLAGRAAAFQSTFYNTQGMQYALTGGAGAFLTADLFIPELWADGAYGAVRTDIWGVLSDATDARSGYPIIGFTNYGGDARYRYWDYMGDGGWTNVSTPVGYDAWTNFGILFTGSSVVYSINGT